MRSLLYRAGPPWRLGLLCLLLAAGPMSAQPPVALTVRGQVTDTAGRPLAFATVSLTDSTGQRRHAYALTDIDGRYRITVGTAPPTAPRIRVEHLRMAPSVIELPPVDGSGDVLLPPIPMHVNHQTLEEIVVRAAAAPVVRKGDTVVYAAKAFADAETRKVEDLLRRLPGFQVSSDGRIHVNGREVDRILIDGDDLTERNYRLLSRSLQAGIVDKVEVVENYHPDRILGQVEASGRVGVNLRTDRGLRDRLALDVGPGLGTAGRYRSDAQATYLADGFKAMAFLDGNRTAGKSGTGLLEALADDPEAQAEAAGDPDMPVRTGRPALPAMEKAYVRDNLDASAVQVLSTRLGSHARLRFSAATGGSRWQAGSVETNIVRTPDAGGWTLHEDRSFREHRREHSTRLALTHDRGRRNTGQWSAALGRRTGTSMFHNRVTGALRDSLAEGLTDGVASLAVKGSETFAWPRKRALSLRYGHGRSILTQDFDILSGRWQGFFGQAPTQPRLRQVLEARRHYHEADITLHGRGPRHDWQLSAALRLADQRYATRVQASAPDLTSSISLRGGESQVRQQQLDLSYTFEMHPRARWHVGAAVMAGRGGVSMGAPGRAVATSAVLYRAMATLRRSFSPRDKLSFSMSAWREAPSPDEFLPDRLDGDATAQAPADRIAFADRRSLHVSYLRQNLPKARSTVLTLGWGCDQGAYVAHVTRSPMVTRITRQPSADQWSARAGLHAERFLDGVRARSVTDLGAMAGDAELWFNGIPGRNRISQASADQKLVSAFDGWFNVEGGWRTDWTSNATVTDNGGRTRHALWQHQGYLKARADWGGRPFIALRYARRSLAPATSIGTLDLFASLQAGSSVRLTLQAHNLTGLGVLSLANLSANLRNTTRYDLVGRYLLLGLSWTR